MNFRHRRHQDAVMRRLRLTGHEPPTRARRDRLARPRRVGLAGRRELPPRKQLRVLDLFSGLGGWSQAFQERGHAVTTVDLDPTFQPDVCADVMKLRAKDLKGPWDLVLASPPCEKFSILNVGRHWSNGAPISSAVKHDIRLVRHTLRLIRDLKPRAWIMENPRAMMRRLPDLAPIERRTVTYCQYGQPTMKPTDLWGNFPPTLRLHPPCKAREPCHESAPSGSRHGLVGIPTSAQRALVPRALGMAVCMAMENLPRTPERKQAIKLEVAR